MTDKHFGPKTEESKIVHTEKYRQRGESFEDAMYRIASELKEDTTHYHTVKDILLYQRFLPAGRIQSAVGASRETTPFNCYVSRTIDDSMEGIMKALAEAAETMRMGGGIGFDFSTLRPKGARIKSLDSTSSGPLSFMEIFNSMCGTIMSAGHRRGAMMGVMRVDHPDIEEFITAKHTPGRLTNFNLSVAVTDEFMNAVKNDMFFELKFNGEVYNIVKARKLWDLIMRSTWDYAEPGVLFIDRINKKNNLSYVETIAATNPCVVEGTLVATPNGLIPVEKIAVGDAICTVSGIGHVETIEVHEDTEVYDVHLTDGSVVTATAAHVFHVARGKKFDADTRLDQLVVGDRVRLAPAVIPDVRQVSKPEFNVSERDAGFFVGAVIGDGCFTEKSKTVKIACDIRDQDWIDTLHGKMKSLFGDAAVHKSTDQCVTVASTELMNFLDKIGLPRGYSTDKTLPLEMLNSNGEFLKGFIDGMISTDGNVNMSSSNPMIRVTSSNKDSLLMLKRALSCFGILSRIYEEYAKLIDSTNVIDGREISRNAQSYVLCILGSGIRTIHDVVGITRPRKAARLHELVMRYSLTGCTWTAQIKAIVPVGRAKVYDLFEPTTDTWITDGVVNRGCGEQPLPPYGACLLGSFNLVKYVVFSDGSLNKPRFDWHTFDADIRAIVPAIDNVIDKAMYPLPEQAEEARNKRRMGLGITGLANAIAMMGYQYGDEDSHRFVRDVMTSLRDTAYRTSIELAMKRGQFPLFNAEEYLKSDFAKTLPEDIRRDIAKYGIRNSHLLSIAPTGTISFTADNISSGIEPVFSKVHERQINFADGPRIVTIKDYVYREFGDKITQVYADELPVEAHVDMLNLCSAYVDSACSKTCNVGADVSWERFKDAYMRAYDGGSSGCTTFRAAGKRYGIINKVDEDEETLDKEGTACYIDPATGKRTCE